MQIKAIMDEYKKMVVELYKETYSISEIRRRLKDGVGRGKLMSILVEAGVYEGLTGKNYLAHKVKKNEQIMKERYGVTNWGQTTNGGYKSLNKIERKQINKLIEFHDFRDAVSALTKKNLKKLQKPEYCYYTGIRFADAEQEKVNPNDDRKRSIDHKMPIVLAWLNGWSIAETAGTENLVFVLKYVNSIKSNTEHASFIPISTKIRKLFIDEGFAHN